jgi:flavin-dependent dehydrogenase
MFADFVLASKYCLRVSVEAYEVAIIGGGFAGQCFARHLLRVRPHSKIVIVERRALPCSIDHRGVGESTSELAAWYLRERLGLFEHLEREQVVKFGLRFWLRERGLEPRIELGLMRPPATQLQRPLPLEPHTYQLHRGRLEHRLALDNQASGVQLLAEHEMLAREHLGDEGWHVRLRGPDQHERALRATWLVDASGGPQLTANGPRMRTSRHRIAAAWWWFDARLDPANWSDDPRVAARGSPDLRWRSTHHLVGPGYWVWLIGLADGSTSIGLVVDASQHRLVDRDDVAALLEQHEAELVRAIGGRIPDALQFWQAPSRICLEPFGPAQINTGAALGFLDPLYSVGHDLSAVIHELTIPVLAEALERGSGIGAAQRAAINRTFVHVAEHYERLYLDAYALFGVPEVAMIKIAWDQKLYFCWPCVLACSGRLGDLEFLARCRAQADRVQILNDRMQALLRAWAQQAMNPEPRVTTAIDQAQLGSVMQHFFVLDQLGRADETQLRAVLASSVDALEGFALAVFEHACERLGIAAPKHAIDPYAIGLDPSRWAADGLFAPRRARLADPLARADLDRIAGR